MFGFSRELFADTAGSTTVCCPTAEASGSVPAQQLSCILGGEAHAACGFRGTVATSTKGLALTLRSDTGLVAAFAGVVVSSFAAIDGSLPIVSTDSKISWPTVTRLDPA
jgi:hypothetical protein